MKCQLNCSRVRELHDALEEAKSRIHRLEAENVMWERSYHWVKAAYDQECEKTARIQCLLDIGGPDERNRRSR